MRALILSSGASHGAFQAGAIRALEEKGWYPDLILGRSVGAINGCGWAAGMSGYELEDLWRDVTTRDVYHWRPLRDWLKFWSWNYILDTNPLKDFIEDRLDLTSVYESDQTILISGVDVRTGTQRIFSSKIGKEISPLRSFYDVAPLDHNSILSSSAIPGIFPWVNGVWDGAFQQNNPIKPAIVMGASEIVVIHLDPPRPEDSVLPAGILQTALRIVELSSSYRLVQDVKLLKERNSMEGYRTIKVHEISPRNPLGYSKLNFDAEEKEDAIRAGYNITLGLNI